MKNLILNIILLITAIVLSVILFPLGWLYSLLTLSVSSKKLSFYFITVALSIDQLGNVMMAKLFNDILIKTPESYKFGDEDDTVSFVLGKNQIRGTLTTTGRILADILDWIDKDHCKKAVDLAYKKAIKFNKMFKK